MKHLLPILLLVFSVGVGAETISHTFSDGSKYVGEVTGGIQHGHGTYTWANGTKYVGEWRDGKQHGQGTITSVSGKTHVGEFKYSRFWQGKKYNTLGEVTERFLDGLPAPTACLATHLGRDKSGLSMGFAVSQHHVVTNAHVLYCCKKVTVYNLPSCSNAEVATIVATEQKSDLGLLRLDRSRKDFATLRRGALSGGATLRRKIQEWFTNYRKGVDHLRLGELIWLYDRDPKEDYCPQYILGQGSIAKLEWMPDDSRLVAHDLRTNKGTSGGPVLDVSGQIVGVHWGRQQLINAKTSIAVKSYLLEAFLKSNNVEYDTAPSKEKLSLSEIKKKSEKFTVMIRCIQ